MNLDRILAKLDQYLSRADYSGAERHLLYWEETLRRDGNDGALLTVLNEEIGLFRKTAQKEKGLTAIEKTLNLTEKLQLGPDNPALGTTFVNAATGYKAFNMPESALPLYERAKEIYEASLEAQDDRLAALYNNMALTVMDTGDVKKARALFEKAMGILTENPGSEPEIAVTWCNFADLIRLEKGPVEGEEEIGRCLDKAEETLDLPGIPRDGRYAYVCEKCAAVFGYYGYFLAEQKYTRRAAEIRSTL